MTDLLSFRRGSLVSRSLNSRFMFHPLCEVVKSTEQPKLRIREVPKTAFRNIISGLKWEHFSAPRRLCNIEAEEDTPAARTTLVSAMMAYVASLAFYASTRPPALAAQLASMRDLPEDQFGVEEVLEDGSSVHHFSKEALRECMKCVVKIHLKNATNVVDKDGILSFFSPESDPFVVFKSGISTAKSEILKDSVNPVWNTDHYLFIRKNPISKDEVNELEVYLFDSDPHLFFWQRNLSIEQRQRKDDLIANQALKMDFSNPDGQIKDHNIQFEEVRRKTGENMELNFSTQILTVDEYLEDIKKTKAEYWTDDVPIQNKQDESATWIELFNATNIETTPIHPLTYFSIKPTTTQFWFFGNLEKKILVVSIMSTTMTELRDLFTNFTTDSVKLGEIVQDLYSLKPKEGFNESNSQVHLGFKRAYSSMREALLEGIYSTTGWSDDWLIIVTGHSLGGSLSTLASYELANRERPDGQSPEVAMFSFGAPSLGNTALYLKQAQTVPIGFRVVMAKDLIADFLFPRLNRLGKAFPSDGTERASMEEILDAECDLGGDRRYEDEETGDLSWIITVSGFAPDQLVHHDQGSYFRVIQKLFKAVFPSMKKD